MLRETDIYKTCTFVLSRDASLDRTFCLLRSCPRGLIAYGAGRQAGRQPEINVAPLGTN